jgi:hypothetical protein
MSKKLLLLQKFSQQYNAKISPQDCQKVFNALLKERLNNRLIVENFVESVERNVISLFFPGVFLEKVLIKGENRGIIKKYCGKLSAITSQKKDLIFE